MENLNHCQRPINISNSYVYFKFPHPAGIQHVAVPGHRGAHIESIESYLFAFPCLQVAFFLALALATLMWPAVIRISVEREARYAAKYPSLRNSDSIQAYKIVMAIVVIFEVFMLLITAYRSVMLATNNI